MAVAFLNGAIYDNAIHNSAVDENAAQNNVVPAQAGTHADSQNSPLGKFGNSVWVPACAGTT